MNFFFNRFSCRVSELKQLTLERDKSRSRPSFSWLVKRCPVDSAGFNQSPKILRRAASLNLSIISQLTWLTCVRSSYQHQHEDLSLRKWVCSRKVASHAIEIRQAFAKASGTTPSPGSVSLPCINGFPKGKNWRVLGSLVQLHGLFWVPTVNNAEALVYPRTSSLLSELAWVHRWRHNWTSSSREAYTWKLAENDLGHTWRARIMERPHRTRFWRKIGNWKLAEDGLAHP